MKVWIPKWGGVQNMMKVPDNAKGLTLCEAKQIND